MIRVYRITKVRYKTDLSGNGAAIAGGRWNRKGLPALYTAENSSLSVLEILAHCDRLSDLTGRIIQEFEIPDDSVEEIDTTKLSPDWRAVPWINETVEKGSLWLEGMRTLALKVPSVINSKESNYVINPRHPRMREVTLVSEEVLNVDRRIFRNLK